MAACTLRGVPVVTSQNPRELWWRRRPRVVTLHVNEDGDVTFLHVPKGVEVRVNRAVEVVSTFGQGAHRNPKATDVRTVYVNPIDMLMHFIADVGADRG